MKCNSLNTGLTFLFIYTYVVVTKKKLDIPPVYTLNHPSNVKIVMKITCPKYNDSQLQKPCLCNIYHAPHYLNIQINKIVNNKMQKNDSICVYLILSLQVWKQLIINVIKAICVCAIINTLIYCVCNNKSLVFDLCVCNVIQSFII